MENQQKWHQKPVTAVLFLIFFFPVGLYLMWKNNLWSKTTRVIVSVFFGLLVVGNLVNDKKGSTSNYGSTMYNNSTSSPESYKDCSRSSHELFVRKHFESTGSQVHGISTLQKNGECGFIFVVNGYNYKLGSYICTVKTEGSNGIKIIDGGCE